MSFEGRSNRKTFVKLDGFKKATTKAVRLAMFDISHSHVREAKRAIKDDPKTGRVYRRKRKGRRRTHQASAAGQTHANESGRLRDSLSFQLHGTNNIEFGYGVSSGKSAPEYAKFVEFGTAKMKPRPTLLNAIRKEEKNTINYFTKALDKDLKP